MWKVKSGVWKVKSGVWKVKSGVWRVESGAEGTRLPPLQGEGDRRAVEGFSNEELGMRN